VEREGEKLLELTFSELWKKVKGLLQLNKVLNQEILDSTQEERFVALELGMAYISVV
jgi:hypothetical protein